MLLTGDRVEEWPRMQKTELAEKLADQIEAEYSS
jgi:phosphopantothenoylcysteine synthetase/decarboxylase